MIYESKYYYTVYTTARKHIWIGITKYTHMLLKLGWFPTTVCYLVHPISTYSAYIVPDVDYSLFLYFTFVHEEMMVFVCIDVFRHEIYYHFYP